MSSFPVPYSSRGLADTEAARRGLELIGSAVRLSLGRAQAAPAGVCPECWRFGRSIPYPAPHVCPFCIRRKEGRAGA